MSKDHTPLCVDLDGTLIRSDLLLEGLLRLVRHRPLAMWRVLFWFLKGKARLKGEVARAVATPATSPPVNQEILAWLQAEKDSGRGIFLVTATHEDALAPIHGLFPFDGIIASDDQRNLTGRTKAAELVQRFGEGGFDYVGDSLADEAVWRFSRQAVPASRSQRRLARIKRKYDCPTTFHIKPATWSQWLHALRIHQWAKNLLIALPCFAGQHFDPYWHINLVAAFLTFSLCASGTYLWNDLLDLDHDRHHSRKKDRLAASGSASLRSILIVSCGITAAGLAGCFAMDTRFGLLSLAYIGASLSYSLYFKRIALLDIFLITFLYLSRVIGGVIISEANVSFWLFGFTFLLFLSLAAAKRRVELGMNLQKSNGRIPGRGYIEEDMPTISAIGIASGIASCVLLALYSHSTQVTSLYHQPEWLWGICIIAFYWISRIWLHTQRGEMHDDPVVFAIKDPATWFMAIAALTCILFASPVLS